MWKVLIFAAWVGAGSPIVLVFDSGVTAVARVRRPMEALKAERDAARRREEDERRAAIV
jgi:hypothetical protein